MEDKTSELTKLEDLIISYKKEEDVKKKHILYINLVENSLILVKKIVAGIYPIPSTISRDDLIQAGAVGLLKAIQTYKQEERGSFKTYATKFIKGKVLQYLRDKANIVKPPRESLSNINKVKEAISELSDDNSKIPSAQEISKLVNISAEKVEEIINAELIKNTISLDQQVYSADGSESLLDRICSEKDSEYEEIYENKKMIEYALNKLTKEEKDIISKYYIFGMTQKDIAAEAGISAMQVGRIIKRSLNKMYNIIVKETDSYKEDKGEK